MRINANHHCAPNHAGNFAGVGRDRWLAASASQQGAVIVSITMTSKRLAGGLSLGGIPIP